MHVNLFMNLNTLYFFSVIIALVFCILLNFLSRSTINYCLIVSSAKFTSIVLLLILNSIIFIIFIEWLRKSILIQS